MRIAHVWPDPGGTGKTRDMAYESSGSGNRFNFVGSYKRFYSLSVCYNHLMKLLEDPNDPVMLIMSGHGSPVDGSIVVNGSLGPEVGASLNAAQLWSGVPSPAALGTAVPLWPGLHALLTRLKGTARFYLVLGQCHSERMAGVVRDLLAESQMLDPGRKRNVVIRGVAMGTTNVDFNDEKMACEHPDLINVVNEICAPEVAAQEIATQETTQL